MAEDLDSIVSTVNNLLDVVERIAETSAAADARLTAVESASEGTGIDADEGDSDVNDWEEDDHVIDEGGGLDLSKFNFGINNIDGLDVTINSGSVFKGETHQSVGESVVTAGTGYIYLETGLAFGSTTSLAFGSEYPTPTPTVWRQTLYEFSSDEGQITLVRIHHIGDLNLPLFS